MGASNPVRTIHLLPPGVTVHKLTANPRQLDRLVGLAMLIIASTIFAYYTVWTLLMVCLNLSPHSKMTFGEQASVGVRTSQQFKETAPS
jgi:hypothetical protein